MEYNITISHSINNDLQAIYESLYDFGENPLKKFNESVDKFVEKVSEMPYLFSAYEWNPKYRRASLAYGYLIFYRVNKEDNTVKLYRVLHGKSNIEKGLEEVDE